MDVRLKGFSVVETPFTLSFKRPAGTSRGVLKQKQGWIIKVSDNEGEVEGIGEMSIIPGLSPESFLPELPKRIKDILPSIVALPQPSFYETLTAQGLPALAFGLESAFADYQSKTGDKPLPFTPFTRGEEPLYINGLVWMESKEEMILQAQEKVMQGCTTLKFKVGALDFDEELELLHWARQKFGPSLRIRLDANGGFGPEDALYKLKELWKVGIESIEQPVNPEHRDTLAMLCKESPIPIALDESLIGVTSQKDALMLLQEVKPQYIILKPSLLGGLQACDAWIALAQKLGIGWWATSALESNIGLRIIAAWVSTYNPALEQGLGTGSLYTSNLGEPLRVEGEKLWWR